MILLFIIFTIFSGLKILDTGTENTTVITYVSKKKELVVISVLEHFSHIVRHNTIDLCCISPIHFTFNTILAGEAGGGVKVLYQPLVRGS